MAKGGIMKILYIFITALFIGTTLSFKMAAAQDSTVANKDSLKSSTDTIRIQKGKKNPLEKFKKAFQKLVNEQDTTNQQLKNNTVEDPELKLMGFVLDATRTPFGRTFYELFYRYWSPPDNASFYTIRITERPTPGRGSQIIIKMNYEQILSFRLQPKYHYIQKISKQAAAYVKRKLKKQSVKGKLLF